MNKSDREMPVRLHDFYTHFCVYLYFIKGLKKKLNY